MITQARLKELVHYNPNTGVFTRLIPAGGVSAGDIVGSNCGEGYLKIMVDGGRYRAHRLAWLYMTGDWPKYQIDHINGVKNDNRIDNLRDVTNAVNQRNTSRRINNKSGVPGVVWHSRDHIWSVSITSGTRKMLGSFTDFFEAVCARKSAELKYNFHPNHGRC
tara:strand:- start:6 stop:494 length:489 start_codon:yes stop_codon:yes gene_type:complete